jgi:hypothetical protein
MSSANEFLIILFLNQSLANLFSGFVVVPLARVKNGQPTRRRDSEV